MLFIKKKLKMFIFIKKNNPFKYLVFKKKTRYSGRSYGKIINRHRGGGFRIMFRSIDYYRFLWNIYGLVLTIEYSPFHNKLLSLIFYFNGIFSYIYYIKNLNIGDLIISSNKTRINLGNSLLLKNIPYGVLVHNVELYPRHGGQYALSSGSFIKILHKFKNLVKVKLKSGLYKFLLFNSSATIGVISDFIHSYKLCIINAGFNRNTGWRPVVRGVAMNAVDHPNGGGKGKKACKSISMSPWKKLPKGKRTVNKN